MCDETCMDRALDRYEAIEQDCKNAVKVEQENDKV